jgi:hypothetical protein
MEQHVQKQCAKHVQHMQNTCKTHVEACGTNKLQIGNNVETHVQQHIEHMRKWEHVRNNIGKHVETCVKELSAYVCIFPQ